MRGKGRGSLLAKPTESDDDLGDHSSNSSGSIGRGRLVGGRNCSGGRTDEEELNDYHPMKEAYEDQKFNSYLSGPGQSLKTSQHVNKRREKDNFKLHIANIASSLDTKAIENIFNYYGDLRSVYVKEISGSATKWGFVEYSSLQDAQRAISGLHFKEPHNLRVSFAREKEAASASETSDVASTPSVKSEISRSRRPYPLQGIDPRKFRTLHKNDVSKEVDDYQKGTYSKHLSPRSEELSNKMMEKFTDGRSHNGKVMCGGRSSVLPRPVPSKNSNSDDREKYKTKDEQQPSLFSPFKNGNCSQCFMVTVFTCSVCKSWYCSYDCLSKDWDKHKQVCKLRTITILPDGQLQFIQNYDTSDELKDKMINGTDVSINGKMDNSSKYEGNQKVDKQLLIAPHNIPECQSSEITIYRNKAHEKNILVRGLEEVKAVEFDEKPSTLTPSCAKWVKSDRKATLVDPPIPRNTFTKCVVVFTKSEDSGLYVTSLFDASDQDEMLCNLAQYYSEHKPKLMNPCEGVLCSAQFIDQCWYRAVIESIDQDNSAIIRFIDFGNEQNVPVKDLYILPEKFACRSPMAFKIASKNGTNNYQINDIVEISPIKQMPDGSWLVRFNGDSEPQPLDEESVSSTEDVNVRKNSELSTNNQVFPLSKDEFLEVTIMYKEESGLIWVVTDKGITCLREMNESLVKFSLNKDEVTLKKDDVYNYNFEGLWCRALLTSLKPYTVFFIDYGNSVDIKPQDLVSLPPNLKSIPPLAIRIQLAEGTSSMYLKMNEMDQLRVKAVKNLTNKVLVTVEGEDYERPVLEKNKKKPVETPRVKRPTHVLGYMKPDSKAYVIVNKGIRGDNFCGALQIVDCNTKDIKNLSEISTCMQAVNTDPMYRPKLNEDVVAKINEDSRLYRGYVVCLDDGITRVALTDVGCIVTPTSLNPLPANFKDFPSTAVRIAFSKPSRESLSAVVDSEITLQNLTINEKDQTVEADFDTFGRVTLSPWVPLLEEIGLPAFPLENNCLAFVTAFYSPKAVYLRPLTSECIDVYNTIIQDVGVYGIKAEPLEKIPLCGELVCARWNSDGNFYRALVSEKDKGKFLVSFLDFGNFELVEFDDLRTLPDHFKKIPATCVKVGLKDVLSPVFNRKATQLMAGITLEEKRVVVTHEGDLRSVVLSEEASGDVVNNILAQAMQLSWVTNPDFIYTDTPFMADDIRYDTWEVNSKIKGIVVGVPNYNSILFINRSSTFEYINDVLTPQITKYCEQSSLNSYSPRPKEFILAKFEGEWYRAVCVSKKINSDFASVFFIDYGNKGELHLDNIRNIPPEFAETPAAIKFCKLYGLPRAESISNDERKEVMAFAESITEVTVVEETNDGQNVVWAPSLEQHLAKMNLSYSKPIGFD